MTKIKNILIYGVLIFIIFTPKIKAFGIDNEKLALAIPPKEDNYNTLPDNNERIAKENEEMKPLEEITTLDIVQDDYVPPEVRERITQLVNQSQNEIDSYRTAIASYYKQLEIKLLEVNKDIDKIHNFKDDMEASLNLAKWMIISLSIGIICLTSIVVIMWRSVVNVNRNDVEIIFSVEKFRKILRDIEGRLELLEALYKNDGKV